jgi:hypothetical protein
MAAVTTTLSAICGGGTHLTFTLSGASSATVPVLLSELSESLTPDELVTYVKCVAKLAKAGRTVAQARTLLEGGVTHTV